MIRRTLPIASLVVIALLIAIAVTVGSMLPVDLPLPTHWGLSGEPDRFSNKWIALLIPVLIVAPVSLLMYALPAIEPRKQGMERSQVLYLSAWAGMLLMGLLIQLAVLSVAFRWPVHGTSFVLVGVGLMFILIGNQLGKSRSTYLMGIRTPWTLASEEVWMRTHRLGGKLMAGGGILLLLVAFAPIPSGLIATLLLAVTAVVGVVPVVYSYLLWRRERVSGQPGA